jgi:hypothetical protein
MVRSGWLTQSRQVAKANVYSLCFFHVKRLQILVAGRLLRELPPDPLDCAFLVTDEEFKLLQSLDFQAAAVVFGCLLRQEKHPIPLRKLLQETGMELASGQWDSKTTLNVEGYHSVVKDVFLPFRYCFETVALHNEQRHLSQRRSHEFPR